MGSVRTQKLREAMDKCLPRKSSGSGSGVESGTGAGLLPAATRRRGGGAEWGAVQPTPASNQGGHPGDPSEGWLAGVEALTARVQEASDDRESVHCLPTRRGKADRCGERRVALSPNGSSGARDGEAYTALQARERKAFRRGDVATVVKRLMASIGLDPDRF